jgi:hypothetical protein
MPISQSRRRNSTTDQSARRRSFRPWPAILILAALTGASMVWGVASRVQAQGCGMGINLIVCENQKPGNPAIDWQITGAGDSTIQ